MKKNLFATTGKASPVNLSNFAKLFALVCFFACGVCRNNAYSQTVNIPATLSCTQGPTSTSTCVGSGYYATGWPASESASNYWQYSLNTAGYSSIQMTYAQSSSNTGPNQGRRVYNVGAGDVSITAYTLGSGDGTGTACSTGLTQTLPAACNNVSSLIVRIRMWSSTSSAGTDRVTGSASAATGIFTGNCSTPAIYTVSSVGTCLGSSITLSGSDAWVSYQLSNGSTTEQTLTGTGSALTFTTTPTAGTYSILGTNIASGCAVTAPMSGSVTIGGTGGVSFTSNPVDQTVCAGGNASFTGSASGATSYIWQKSTAPGGSTYANLTTGEDGGIYGASFTTPTLTLTSPGVALSGYNYVLTATGSCGAPLSSSSAALTVNPYPSPMISAAPAAIAAGDAAVLTFTGVAGDVLYYWDGTDSVAATIGASGTATVSVSPSVTTTYSVTSATSASGCTASVSGQVAQVIVAQPYYKGNLVVEQALSTGTPSSSGTTISLLQYTTSGTLVNTNILPTSGPSRIVISGTATSEGLLSLSAERDRLIVVGYDTTLGALSVASSSDNRTLGELPPSGVFTKKFSSGSPLLTGNNVRSGTSYSTNYFGASAVSGVVYANSVSPVAIESAVSNARYVQAYNNSLYFTSNSTGYKGLSQLSAPISSAAGQVPALVASDAAANPYGFAISPDGNTAYIADATAGIQKYTRTGGTGDFTFAYTVYATPCTGLAVDFTNTVTPALYATLSSGLSLIGITDPGTTTTSFTTIATTTATAPFRGVMFAPAAYASVAVTGPDSMCSGSSTMLTFKGNPYATVTYNVNGIPATATLDSGGTRIVVTGPLTTTTTYSIVNVNNPSGNTPVSDSVKVTIYAPPAVYSVTGTGAFCTGTAGGVLGLSGSDTGVNYQLYQGATATGAPVAGTGTAISFGSFTTAGTYSVSATNATTGCTNDMADSAVITINPVPSVYSVTGTGSYCSGGAGIPVGLTSSEAGVDYQLYNGSTAVGLSAAGIGTTISFGTYTAAGIYTVLATNAITGCTAAMTDSAVVTINPLPAVFDVTGTGSYCAGGAGVSIGLDGSASGITYQLYEDGTATGFEAPGTGSAMSFGTYTAAATYSVIAVNETTGCLNAMNDSATITINPLPSAYSVTGTGSYCAGTAGLMIGLSNSDAGINYQLYNGATAVGSVISGTGSAISFGIYTTAATYTVVATNAATGCTNAMSDSAVITINPLPAIYSVTGTGSYCLGTTGVTLGLSGSDAGITYQLYDGATAVGSAIDGTGASVSFGVYTSAATYTVAATSTVTGCTTAMSGSAVITINPLPSAYSVTGSGSYCSGSTGLAIGLDNSQAGVSYQLFDSASPAGSAIAGTGSAISFGIYTAAATYTVLATNTATGCTTAMSDSAVISINPLPAIYSVTGTGSYCSGTTGVTIGLANTDAGISYQLYEGSTATGTPVPGTGSSISFGIYTTAATYTVLATNTTTGCTNQMGGSAVITINPLPTVYSVTGTGSYCAGSMGVAIGLDNSETGVNYQLYDGTTPEGSPVTGTGSAIALGIYTAAATYTVLAADAAAGCTIPMADSAVITINPLPVVYSVTGTGSYCSGSTGLAVGLSGSQAGISYQLYNGTTAEGSAVAGTGSAISFGIYTTGATYTVAATNTVTGCSVAMAESAVITVNALPTLYTVTGTGSYCAGGTGVNIALTGSGTGISYQLYEGGAAVGSALTGTGFSLDFGLETTAGVYQVVALNTTTGCTDTMGSSATITINPLPSVYPVTGGGTYCSGGSGLSVGLGSSDAGIIYQLYDGTTATGFSVGGTGAAIGFGTFTATGTYTVSAINATSGCTTAMADSAVISVTALPTAYNMTGGGSYCAGGPGVDLGLDNSDTGVNYQLFNGATPVGSPIAGTGSALDLGFQTAAGTYTVEGVNATYGCSGAMAGSEIITITALVTPSVSVDVTADSVCAGTIVSYTALPVNAGPAPGYQWYVDGTPVSPFSTYSYAPASGDMVVITITSSDPCAAITTVSDTVSTSVTPLVTPAVTVISSASDTICAGTPVTFTATGINGGSTPGYQWSVNGVTAGTGITYTYTPLNGDMVTSLLTSSAACATPDTASGTLVMTVADLATPVVTVSAAPGTALSASGTATFTATVVNGGSAPAYQWFVNGVPVPGATSATYISDSLVGDTIGCAVLNTDMCGSVGADSVIILHNVGVGQVVLSGMNIQLVPNPSSGTFTVRGNLGATQNMAVTLEITNMLGQNVFTKETTAQNGDINELIQLSNTLPNGMYILNIHSGGNNVVFHFVLKQ